MALDLRPLTLGELFDRAFALYRRHFWLFVGITAVPGVFALIVSLAQQTVQNLAASPVAPEDQLATAFYMLGLTVGILVALLVYLVVYTVALGATTYGVSEISMGRSVTIGGVYRKIRGRALRLILLMVIVGLRIGGVGLLGAVLAVIVATAGAVVHAAVGGVLALGVLGGVIVLIAFMGMRYSLAVPSLVLEDLHASQSLKRSVELTTGRLGRVFLLILCATMVTYATALLFQGPFLGAAFAVGAETRAGMWLNIIAAFTGTIGTTLTAPFMIIGLALLYYDARIREEGYDLEVTLAALDAEPSVSARG